MALVVRPTLFKAARAAMDQRGEGGGKGRERGGGRGD